MFQDIVHLYRILAELALLSPYPTELENKWFDPQHGQYSFRRLMIVIEIRSIPLSPLSFVSGMVMRKSSQWLRKNIVQSTGAKNSRKAWTGALAAAISLSCWKGY